MEPPRGRRNKRVDYNENNDDQGQDYPKQKKQMNKYDAPVRRESNTNLPAPSGKRPVARRPESPFSDASHSMIRTRAIALTPSGETEFIDLSQEAPPPLIIQKRMVRPSGEFPRFMDGADVYIELKKNEYGAKYCYALHSYVLSRASPWFEKALKFFIPELDEAKARIYQDRSNIAHWFEMQHNSKTGLYFLVKAPRQMIKELAKIERVPAQQESRASIAKPSVNTARLDNAVQEDIANQEATSSKPLLECTHMKRPRNDATFLEAGPGADTPKPSVEVSQSSSTQEGENAAPEIKKEDEDANIANVAIKEEDDNEEVSIENVPAEKSKQGSGAVLSEEKNIDKPSSGSQTTTNTPVETASTANMLAVLEANPSATTKSPGRLRKTPIEKVTAIAMEIIEQNRTKKANSENRELRALETYNSLFLVFYNKPPTISTTDINTALQQSEGLAKLAEHLECVSLVRHHLSNTLLSYGRELYKAILQDPPRWLLLSIYLESAPIFREAIIHIVGMHPIWPWSETATRDYFKPDILALIDRKALYLKTLKAEINSKLFCSSITVDGKEVRLSKSNKATFDTFFVVSLWRDWFVKGIARTKSARGKAMEKPANPGKHVIDVVPYRLMGQGGEAYLSLGETLTMLRDFKGKDFAKWDPREVNEDLMIMKLFAMKEVKPLLASESMLDVEAEGIRYFTCTKIANEELPWVKQE